jgi:hypothetical protein
MIRVSSERAQIASQATVKETAAFRRFFFGFSKN